MKFTVLLRVFGCLAFFILRNGFASEIVVEDISSKALKYDVYYQSYVPIVNSTEKLSNKHFVISFSQFVNCELKFEASPGLTILIDNKLVFRQADTTSIVYFPISKLTEYSNPSKQGDVFISFFHEENKIPEVIQIVNTNADILNSGNSNSENEWLILPRLKMGMQNQIFYLVLLVLILVTILKSYYPRDFLFFWSIRREFLDENLKPKLFAGSFWIIISSICLLASIAFFLLYHEINPTFSVLLKIVLAVLIAIASKLIYNFILAIFFGTVKTVFTEFLEFLRVVLLIMAGLSLALTLAFLTVGYYIELKLDLFMATIIIIMLITVLRMVSVQFNLLNARNLHIISYICAAEILPLVIAAKVLLFR